MFGVYFQVFTKIFGILECTSLNASGHQINASPTTILPSSTHITLLEGTLRRMLSLDMIPQRGPRRKNNTLLAMHIMRTHVPRIVVRPCVDF
jgi:hypothetical protein